MCKIFILQSFFQSDQHIYEKREGSIPLNNGSGPGRPKKHADPADPDPQHWLNLSFVNLVVRRESKLRMGVLEALAAITPFLSRETVLDKACRDTHLVVF